MSLVIFSNTVTRNLKQAGKSSSRLIATSTLRSSTVIENITPEGWDKALPFNNIPGPRSLPIIGNLWMFLPIIGPFFRKNITDFHDELYKYGKLVRLSLKPRDILFVYHPEDMEMVHRNEGIYPIREGATKTLGYYRNNVRRDIFQGVAGILTVHGKEWHDIRSKINPILLSPQTLLQYIDGIDSVSNALLSKIRHFVKIDHNKEMPDDFMNILYSWTLESVAYIALDKRIGCLDFNLDDNSEATQLINHVLRSITAFALLELRPTYKNIYKTKLWKEYVESADFLTFVFYKYIQEAEGKINEVSETGMSALQQMIKIDRRIAIATALDMLIAGVDTSGKQVASILYYLAKNQNVQDTLRNELLALLPTKESPVTKDVLAQAPYLKAVIKETERIAPIIQGNMRTSVQDIVLSGYRIPKGTQIITCNGFASQLTNNYPRPTEFLPERWLRTTTGELSHKNTNPFVTLPFGFGPRSCVGKRIAKLEMEVGIAKMIRNFRVDWLYKDATFGGSPFVGVLEPLKLQFNELEQ